MIPISVIELAVMNGYKSWEYFIHLISEIIFYKTLYDTDFWKALYGNELMCWNYCENCYFHSVINNECNYYEEYCIIPLWQYKMTRYMTHPELREGLFEEIV